MRAAWGKTTVPISRPSATSPGGWAKALWRSRSAVRTSGQAATREAPCARGLRAKLARSRRAHSSSHPLARRRARQPNSPAWRAATAAWRGASSARQCPTPRRRAPPGGKARRCRAGASRPARATARLMVPLPEPLGPSMRDDRDTRRQHDHPLEASVSARSMRKPAARAVLDEPGKGGGDVGHVAGSRSARGPEELRRRMPSRCGDRRGCRCVPPAEPFRAAQPQSIRQQLVLDPERCRALRPSPRAGRFP